ncbi:MAG: hypothetical protein ACTHK3_09290, partial [Solirubrobacterales bacterium]
THHWTISSAVIAGYVINKTFSVHADDRGPHQLYKVHYLADGRSERRRTETQVSVEAVGQDRWRAGERYEIPLETYHSTTVPERVFAATAILTGKRTDLPPLVLGDSSGNDAYQYSVESSSPDKWAKALRQLRLLMEA